MILFLERIRNFWRNTRKNISMNLLAILEGISAGIFEDTSGPVPKLILSETPAEVPGKTPEIISGESLEKFTKISMDKSSMKND